MTGRGLLKRILLTLALACGFLLFLAALDADATPIRPDVRRIVTQPQQDATAQSMPARAGWDGPEISAGSRPVATSLPTTAGLVRAERAELIEAATPDPRAIVGIAAVIFLLRLLRREPQVLNAPSAGLLPRSIRPLPEEDRRIAA